MYYAQLRAHAASVENDKRHKTLSIKNTYFIDSLNRELRRPCF